MPLITEPEFSLLVEEVDTAFNAGIAAAVQASPAPIYMETTSTGESRTHAWLNGISGWEKWVDERRMQRLKGDAFRIVNEDWENGIVVKRKEVEDNELADAQNRARLLGEEVVNWRTDLSWDVIANGLSAAPEHAAYDDLPLFSDSHPTGSNYIAGANEFWALADLSKFAKPVIFQNRVAPEMQPPPYSHLFEFNEYKFGLRARGNAAPGLPQTIVGSKTTLDETNLSDAIERLSTMKRSPGERRYWRGRGTHLFVTPGNATPAKKLIAAMYGASGESNIFHQAVTVVEVPELIGV